MTELVFKNFELTRNFLLKNVEAFNEAIVDVQPEGFNNTIHWHVGHVLTVAEQIMFGFPKRSTNLPAAYIDLFATGTKPSNWQGDVPSVKELTLQLRDQWNRIKEIPAESLNERLKQPFLGCETFGELTNFSIFHEANHLGQIHAMKRVVEALSK
jgi:hypothetical protein